MVVKYALPFHVYDVGLPPVFFPRIRIGFFMVALAAILLPVERADGYALENFRWSDGSQIVMHLGLSHSPSSFPDGSGSWNSSATDALNIWNQYIDRAKFVADSSVTPIRGDGANSVFFSNTVYGQTWGTGVLAITLYTGTNSTFSETDVIFNNKIKWSSYRGALIGFGPSGTYDFHRVALHEFGHVLGLDHPDQHGQSVVAQMNSIISDLDHLSDDDISGARFLYGLQITSSSSISTQSGANFSYQITADNNPTSYSATGLPPGLQLDPNTGLITGRCTSSGTFTVSIVVQGTLGTATGTLQITIAPYAITSSYLSIVLRGEPLNYQIQGSNNPTSFSATGLPSGLTLDLTTGIISGSVDTPGYYYVTVNGESANGEASGTIVVDVILPTITSYSYLSGVNIGSPFFYQITSNNHTLSWTATGLPAGLKFDPVTGLVSGVPTLSGVFHFQVTSNGAHDNATATITLSVNPVNVPTQGYTKINIAGAGGLLADPKRDRVYVAASAMIVVLDSKLFTTIATISSPQANNASRLSLSVDGNTLYCLSVTANCADRIDLTSLTSRGLLPLPASPRYLCEGADGNLYVITGSDPGVAQIDRNTGGAIKQFYPGNAYTSYGCQMELSKDGGTLFVSDDQQVSNLSSYDVSNSATSPVLLQHTTVSGQISSIRLTPNDQSLLCMAAGGSPVVFSTTLRPTSNLSTVTDSFSPPDYDAEVTFTSDNARTALAVHYENQVDLYNTNTGLLQNTIYLPDPGSSNYRTSALAIDRSNTNLFVAALNTPASTSVVYIYPLVHPPAPPTPDHSLLNVSTRLRAQDGDNVLIGGFIIDGTASKNVVLRAMGPSLPLQSTLADPTLELHLSDGSQILNDNWNEHRTAVIASGLWPANEHESVIVANLMPGAYTAILRGLNNTSGIALVELYDLSPESDSRIANISTRGRVEAGDNVMIGGFIIGGTVNTKVIIRAIGPSLAGFGVPAALSDTTLELHDPNGNASASNDDWQSDQEAEIMATNLAPTDARESAIIATLPPGGYTAIVRGKNNTTGVALVEVYNLENN